MLFESRQSFPAVHPEITIDDALVAVDELLAVVCDFRFEAPEHRSAWLAGLLTPLARFAFDGPAPLFLIDANVRGAGKGLLAQTIGRIVLGREMPVSSYAAESDEMRKRITAISIAGDRMVLLDNLEGNFGNDALDRALTSTRSDTTADALAQLIAAWKQYDPSNSGVASSDMLSRLYPVQLHHTPQDSIDNAMRSALENMVGCPPGKTPTPRQVGNKLRQFRRRVQGAVFLDVDDSRGRRDGAVWKLFGSPV